MHNYQACIDAIPLLITPGFELNHKAKTQNCFSASPNPEGMFGIAYLFHSRYNLFLKTKRHSFSSSIHLHTTLQLSRAGLWTEISASMGFAPFYFSVIPVSLEHLLQFTWEETGPSRRSWHPATLDWSQLTGATTFLCT